MLQRFVLLCSLLILPTASGLWAQQATDSLSQTGDTLAVATEQARKEGFFKKNYPDPKKAGLLSLALPGAGQLYNGDWWKLPFVYGAIGGMIYLIDSNTSQYKRLQDAYQKKLKNEKHEFSDTRLDNAQTLRSVRDGYDKNRQLSYVGLFVVYALNGMEAFVDAHLRNFDINEDLSMRLRPQIGVDQMTGQAALGIGVVLTFPAK